VNLSASKSRDSTIREGARIPSIQASSDIVESRELSRSSNSHNLTWQGIAFTGCDDRCPALSLSESSGTWKGKLRVNALKNLDQFLDWSVDDKLRTYPLVYPIQEKIIEMDIPEIKLFVEKYGYFSIAHPIVAKVTPNDKDLELVCCLLKTLYDKGAKGEYLEIAVAEVLSKVLAYRDLKVGQKIHIPMETEGVVSFELFAVDRIFNIWHGMPAFGLLPAKRGLSSLLLFRGTEFSITTERGWASIMSDLDMAGPGFSAFKKAQDQLSDWLQKVKSVGKSARTMGFSLGGALAAYTFIYENAALSLHGSIAICAPGVADKVIDSFNQLAAERRSGFTSYVNRGDIVSKVGQLFGNVYCLWSSTYFKPLSAHTMLMCSLPVLTKALVDIEYKEVSQ
jgi:hypothetical protein